MQISSGWAKGARLATPQGDTTRPTAAKVRAAALNILMPLLQEASFLDLFAGSGAMGLEAVSRGARSATFVDQAPGAIKALRANISEVLRRATAQNLIAPELRVHSGPLPVALGRLSAPSSGPFDLVFVDPPYRDVPMLAADILTGLVNLVAPSATVLFESAVGAEAAINTAAQGAWVIVKQRAYGETLLTMLEKT